MKQGNRCKAKYHFFFIRIQIINTYTRSHTYMHGCVCVCVYEFMHVCSQTRFQSYRPSLKIYGYAIDVTSESHTAIDPVSGQWCTKVLE